MIWQDIVITIVTITFAVSLIPQVYHGFKKREGVILFQTSVPAFLGLYSISLVYITLHLYFSSIMCFFTGTLWLVLCMQRVMYKKR